LVRVTRLLSAFDAARLAAVSPERRSACLPLLRDLENWLAPTPLGAADADAVAAFLAERIDEGFSPATVRKWRAMILAFYAWAWREGRVSGDALLELRAIRPPNGSAARAKPQPYRPGELRELQRVLDRRWPRLPDDEARRWVERWRDGRSPYSRIRTHAIRTQLDAIIALALRCGLRRDEIFRLGVEWIDPDNAYVVVWDKDGPWRGKHRTVPYTDSAREAIRPWVRLRRKINPDHACAWLSLWSAETVREPMKRHTFDRQLLTYLGEGWTLRRLRATCIVAWIRAGLQLEDLRDMLGYSDIAELLPYARCAGGGAGRGMNRLDAGFCEAIGAITIPA
jgi:integrase